MRHTSAVFILWQTTQTCHCWCIFINLGLLPMYNNNNKSRTGIAMKYILCEKALFSLQSRIVGQYFFSTTSYDDDEFPVALTWSCLRSCCPALILHSFVGNTNFFRFVPDRAPWCRECQTHSSTHTFLKIVGSLISNTHCFTMIIYFMMSFNPGGFSADVVWSNWLLLPGQQEKWWQSGSVG